MTKLTSAKNFYVSILIIFFMVGFFSINTTFSVNSSEKEEKSKSDALTTEEESKQLYGEQYNEPDDELFYKSFKINPVTPKEGIRGGHLIYWGHYIEPPYKIEVRGEGLNQAIYINNLKVYPSPQDWSGKMQKRYEEKNRPKIELSKNEEKRSGIAHKINQDVSKAYADIVRKNGLSEEGKKKIIQDLSRYLLAHQSIDRFKIESIYSFRYHIKGFPLFAYESCYIDNPEEFLKTEEEQKKEELIEHLNTISYRLDYFKRFLSDPKNVLWSKTIIFYESVSRFKKISELLKLNVSKIDKIKILSTDYLHSISDAKLVYYNFDDIKFVRNAGDLK